MCTQSTSRFAINGPRHATDCASVHVPMHMACGLALIELIIVAATIAILGAVAYPSYQEHILRSRRTEGQSLLHEAAARQERYRAQHGGYTTLVSDLKLPYGDKSENGFYQLSITTSGLGYRLTAIPQGSQSRDARCASLILTDSGNKSSNPAGNATICWK